MEEHGFEEEDDVASEEDVHDILEELYLMAAELEDDHWVGATYREFEDILQLLRAGEEAEAESRLGKLENFLDGQWQNYQRSAVAPQEVTKKTFLCHTLLSEAADSLGWALSVTYGGDRTAENTEAVLEAVAWASRLLVTADWYSKSEDD